MPTQKFAFKRGGEKKLEISNPRSSKFHTISLNGKTLATITKQELGKGWSYQTSKGVLTIEKGSGLASRLLDVRWNGKPLPESSGDPQKKLNVVTWVIFFIAIINLGIGVIVFLLDRDFFGVAFPEDSPFLVLTGLIYGVLGIFTRRGSAIALGLTVAGYSFDTLFLLIGAFEAVSVGIFPDGAASAMVTRAIFFYYLVRGFAPILELKREAANSRPDVDVAPFQPSDKRVKSFFEPETKSGKPAVAPRKANKLSTLEMILIGIVVILVVVIGDLLLLGASLNNNPPPVNQVAALPTVIHTSTPPPTATPPPTSTPKPSLYPYGAFLEIPRVFIDVGYSPALNRIVGLVRSTNLMTESHLYMYELLTRVETTMSVCNHPPANIVLNPAGDMAVVGYRGGVCILDLRQEKIINDFALNPDYTVGNQTLTDDGWLYFSFLDDDRYPREFHAINIHQPSLETTLVEESGIKVSRLVGQTLYLILSNNSIDVWDISNGWPSPVRLGIYPLACGNFWMATDENFLIDGCSKVFDRTDFSAEAQYYRKSLNAEYSSRAISIVDLVDSVSANQIVVIGDASQASPCENMVYIYNRQTFQMEGHFQLPSDNEFCTKRIFMDPDGLHYYIWTRPVSGKNELTTHFVIGDLSIFSE